MGYSFRNLHFMHMRCLTVCALACLAAAAHCVAAARVQTAASTLSADPSPPSWPDSYSVEYTFSLPFMAKIQPDMITYSVAFHRDAGAAHADKDKDMRVRMDTLNATNVMIATLDTEYELTPRLDRQVCRLFTKMEPGDSVAHMQALPDLRGWEYRGQEEMHGQAADLWAYERRHEGKVVLYRFYAAADGTPLRFHMHGNDAFSGAHFDEWVADYTYYRPGRPDPALFEEPDLCENVEPVAARGPTAGALRMLRSVPAARYGGDPGYDSFLAGALGAGRRHGSLAEYRRRAAVFGQNVAKIAAHNARANRTFSMAMNRFGDWTREEFRAVMLPRRHRRDTAAAAAGEDEDATWQVGKDRELGRHELEYKPLTDPLKVPTAVDWRGSGAAGAVGVKDQANCGSCWAFGAAGAMEAAWFMATGETVSLSEQAVMDCAWGFVPGKEGSASACDGGDAWAGVGHVVDAGGVAALRDYQYLGQNDYCREGSAPVAAKFKGYARLPRYDDAALMEAVYSRGPVAVSLDASQDSFTFYSSGVYHEAACMWKPSQLDHSMMLVGYGTDASGDYWLVRNSWSDNWGDKGYVKVARDGHGCGASTDALYAVVDEEAAAEAAARVAAMRQKVEAAGGVQAAEARR